MPFYHKQGTIPAKRHTQFRKPDGNLYAEELVSTEGFSSIYSLVYHCHPPTLVKNIGKQKATKNGITLYLSETLSSKFGYCLVVY